VSESGSRHVPRVVDDELDAAFRAGRHQEVVARAWDAASATWSVTRAPFVIGSLALLGRVDEAHALATRTMHDASTPPEVRVEVVFFAVVGACHTGRYAEALQWTRRLAAQARDPEPRTRFFVYQGIALLRYFTSRMDAARRASKRALHEAVLSGFAFGRLLALDLRGHVLVQRGEVNAGLRVLDQAASLAGTLGAEGHRAAIESAKLAYQNRHGRRDETLEAALSEVAASTVDNLYAHRAAWHELAFRAALVGDAERAREALERGAELALADADYRARARYFTTHAFVSRLDRRPDDVGSALRNAAAALVGRDDRVLFAEVALWDAWLGAGTIDMLHDVAHRLARSTGTFFARVNESLRGGEPLGLAEEEESPLWGTLAGRAPRQERAERAIARGWLGTLPTLFGVTSGRHVFFVGEHVVVDDRGSLTLIGRLPGHGRALLEALASAERSKESLVAEVWKVPRYAPHLHDAVVHTAIARLRRALGPAQEWLRTTPSGYALDAVDLVSSGVVVEAAPSEASGEGESDPLEERVLGAIGKGHERVPELASALDVSAATVLRRLRALQAQGRVVREGSGKGTRYRLP
jgi:hypothetical protein